MSEAAAPWLLRAEERGLALGGGDRRTYPDFCHVDYDVDLTADPGLHPAALLVASFAVAGVLEPALSLALQVRLQLGECRTIWGVKCRDGALSWELYLYNRRGLNQVTPADVQAAVDPYIDFRPTGWLPPTAPDAFSIDIGVEALERQVAVEHWHVYRPNSAARRRGGMSYRVDAHGLTMENTYYVFALPAERDDLALKLSESLHLDAPRVAGSVLHDSMFTAPLVHVANKPTCDGVYVSRVDARSMAEFAHQQRYAAPFATAVRDLADDFGRVTFDLGVDVRSSSSGSLVSGSSIFVPL